MKSEMMGDKGQTLEDFGSHSDETSSHQRICDKKVTRISQKFKGIILAFV